VKVREGVRSSSQPICLLGTPGRLSCSICGTKGKMHCERRAHQPRVSALSSPLALTVNAIAAGEAKRQHQHVRSSRRPSVRLTLAEAHQTEHKELHARQRRLARRRRSLLRQQRRAFVVIAPTTAQPGEETHQPVQCGLLTLLRVRRLVSRW